MYFSPCEYNGASQRGREKERERERGRETAGGREQQNAFEGVSISNYRRKRLGYHCQTDVC